MDRIYWHHVTITWHPATDGKTAHLEYSFNDYSKDGSQNDITSGDNFAKVTATEPVDISTFSSNKVRWGFTGATGNGDNGHNAIGTLLEHH